VWVAGWRRAAAASVAVAVAGGCPPALGDRSALVVSFGRLMGGMTLSHASVGRLH
jgi:hypothetical protein